MKMVLIVVFAVIYETIYFEGSSTSQREIIGNTNFFFTFLLMLLFVLLPYIAYRKWESHFKQNIINNLKKGKYEKDYTLKNSLKQLDHYNYILRSINKFREMFKGEVEIDPDNENIGDTKIKRLLDIYRLNEKQEERLRIRNISEPNLFKPLPMSPKNMIKLDELNKLGDISEEPSVKRDSKFGSSVGQSFKEKSGVKSARKVEISEVIKEKPSLGESLKAVKKVNSTFRRVLRETKEVERKNSSTNRLTNPLFFEEEEGGVEDN